MRIHIDQPSDNQLIEKFRLALPLDNVDHTLVDNVLDDDDQNIIFIDGETNRLAPLREKSKRDGETMMYDDYSLYNLLTLDFKDKNVYYVTPDFNIRSNLKRLKKIITCEIKNNVIPLVHPYNYGFFAQHLFSNDIHVNINNFNLDVNGEIKICEPKYNVVSLNCTKKVHRILTIKALRNEERFVYSYYPFEDEHQLENSFNNTEDFLLLNELTELNEIYDHDSFMNKSEKPLENRTKREIAFTFETKHEAFQRCVPLEYIQSCIDLVTESYVDESIALTEKTFKPISLRKPFILLSARNSHLFLKELGFQLYEELFDYSFDNKSFDVRFNSIIKQIKSILSMPTYALHVKIESIKEKIQYNYEHMKSQEKKWHKMNDADDFQYLNFLVRNQ